VTLTRELSGKMRRQVPGARARTAPVNPETLKPAGPGHAPDLQALLSEAGKERSIVLSASIWCAADRAPTFDALAKQLERVAGSVPESIAAAVRAGKEAKATAGGLTFEVVPVEVDAQACGNVPAGELGPVMMKVDVEVKPAG